MGFEARIKRLSDREHQYRFVDLGSQRAIETNATPMTFAEVIKLWQLETKSGKHFRVFTTQTLIESPFVAFRWETPVLTQELRNREFEFVLVDSPSLDRRENRDPFREQLDAASSNELTIVFPNLGNNAVLVVPTESSSVDHCHLASYLRSADLARTDDLWKKIATEVEDRISAKPLWLSAAGGGVAWLHVRLDGHPKYYSHQPYKSR